MKALTPKCIITQLPADHPWFVKTEKNVNAAWKKFLTTSEAKFLCKPRPKYLQDIILGPEKLSHFLIGAVLHSPDELSNIQSIMYSNSHGFFPEPEVDYFKPDAFATPLLWVASNPGTADCLIVGDMPELIYRDQIARSIELKILKDGLKTYMDSVDSNGSKFDIRFVHKDIFITKKVKYMAEIIKQGLLTYNKIVVVVEKQLLEPLEEAWVKVSHDPIDFQQLLEIPKMPSNVNLADYVEKHVILDIMLGNFLNDFYIKHKIFPYSAHGAIGADDAGYDFALDSWEVHFKEHGKELMDNLVIDRRFKKAEGLGRKTGKKPKKSESKPKDKAKELDDISDSEVNPVKQQISDESE